MPRKSRIDAPGALHHVIVKGIEGRQIFADEEDRRSFLGRLEKSLVRDRTPCYAWALLPNHVHLLLETGRKPVGRVMQSVLTGYALAFNRRHQRTGHLFQNRFKSILCEREAYLLELIRYIHLNPLRAGLVSGISALDLYPWSGHSVLMGHRGMKWQAMDEVLGLFGKRMGEARGGYRRFVEEGISMGRRSDLTGGGLVRSLGGWEAVAEARRNREWQAYDERILGSGDFVVRALREAEEKEKMRSRLRRDGWVYSRVLACAAKAAGISPRGVFGPGKRAPQSLGRSLACKWLVEDLGLTQSEVARRLGITQQAVGQCIPRGSALEKKLGIRLGAGE